MYRVAIKIERVSSAIVRRGVTTQAEQATPELSVSATASSVEDALDKAIRILTGERNALIVQEDAKKDDDRPRIFEDDEDEDED